MVKLNDYHYLMNYKNEDKVKTQTRVERHFRKIINTSFKIQGFYIIHSFINKRR